MGEKYTKKEFRKSKIYMLAQMGVMTAVICVLAPLSIPIGVIPISFANLAIMLAIYILGWKKGTICTLCYILIGMAGVPVFSSFTGGIGKLLGPTGGYIVGYIPFALLSGWIIQRFRNPAAHFIGLVLGTVVLYAVGTFWYCYVSGAELNAALSGCVYPFIPGDLIKIVISMVLGPMVKNGLTKAGLI